MKDLYTFDYSSSRALQTYQEVRDVYSRLFDELKIPYLVAHADSGDMGGNLSHEFHFPTPKGEDHIISCTHCDYVANEELADSTVALDSRSVQEILMPLYPGSESAQNIPAEVRVWRGISRDRQTLVNVWYSSQTSSEDSSLAKQPEVNLHAIKSIVPGLDPSIEDPLPFWRPPTTPALTQVHTRRQINLVDFRVPESFRSSIESKSSQLPFWPDSKPSHRANIEVDVFCDEPKTGRLLNLLRTKEGDACIRCLTGTLKVQRAIELGHTFHLGTRYSEPLKAMVTIPSSLIPLDSSKDSLDSDHLSSSNQQVPMQMGCHGIGVSRIIGAVADALADERGLNWPRVMAPFEAVVIPTRGHDEGAQEVYDALFATAHLSKKGALDLVLDDRAVTFPWKMQDADLVGFPIIIVVGRRWNTERICEVQCRRLQVHQDVKLGDLLVFVDSLLSQL